MNNYKSYPYESMLHIQSTRCLRTVSPLPSLSLSPAASVWLLLLAVCLFCGGVPLAAQNIQNIIYLPDTKVDKGRTATVSFYMNNSVPVTAIQFTLPQVDGIEYIPDGIALSDRFSNHQASAALLNDGSLKVVVFSPDNSLIAGQSGKILELQADIDGNLEDEQRLRVEIKDAIMSSPEGVNVCEGSAGAWLTTSHGPDLAVKSLVVAEDSIAPESALTLSWTVVNDGEYPANGGWKENVYLTDESNETLVGTVYYDCEGFASGASAERSARLELPRILGVDGSVRVKVTLVPGPHCGESPASQANNTAFSDYFDVAPRIYLSLPQRPLEEGTYYRNGLVTLRRSGNPLKAERFYFSVNPSDSRLEIPTAYDMKAGQSSLNFDITVKDNDKYDRDSVVTLTVSSRRYADVSGRIEIKDNDEPVMHLALSAREVSEGETLGLTVTIPFPADYDLPLKVSSDMPGRFTIPDRIVIPAGEECVSFQVACVDDKVVQTDDYATLTVNGGNFRRASVEVMVIDNDMPALSMKLSPTVVGEDAGISAIMGEINRSTNIDVPVSIELTSSSGDIYFPAPTVVMRAGTAKTTFSVGIRDNDLAEGDREVEIRASVYSVSCECTVPETSVGSVAAMVTVTDNDGPSLKLLSLTSAFREGSEGNEITVISNRRDSNPVVVTLSDDTEGRLVYPASVVIPAGETVATVGIDVLPNDIEGDSQTASLIASAEGFSSGSCWIMITDSTLPDAVAECIVSLGENPVAGGELPVAVRVRNVGNAPLPENTRIKVMAGTVVAATFFTPSPLGIGEAVEVEGTVTLPDRAGELSLKAVINENREVAELNYNNNETEPLAVMLASPFRASVAVTGASDYPQGASVGLKGHIEGTGGNATPVEITMTNRGITYTLSAATDAYGDFSADFSVPARLGGRFGVDAGYPGEYSGTEQASFYVHTLRTSDSWRRIEGTEGNAAESEITVENPGEEAETGIAVNMLAEPVGCRFSFSVPERIDGGGSAPLKVTMEGFEPTRGRQWLEMPVEIVSSGGARSRYILYYYVKSLTGRLASDLSAINTTMSATRERRYTLTVRNDGAGSTGEISVVVPDWMKTATPAVMPALAAGDSAKIILRFIPFDGMEVNMPVSGMIGINCQNAPGLSLPFTITPVSKLNGTIRVTAVDESTFYTEEHPGVAGSKVALRNPATLETVAELTTGPDGSVSAEIPEGWYELTVEADNHGVYVNNILVDPGRVNNIEAFLPFSALTYSWNVEETTVEDEYETELIVEFETRVPKPVVTVTLPQESPGPLSVFPIVVTNHGLVSAGESVVSACVSEGWKITMLSETGLGDLLAGESRVLYAMLEYVGTGAEAPSGAPSRIAPPDDPCLILSVEESHFNPCPKYPARENSRAYRSYGRCYSGDQGGYSGGGAGGGYGGYGGGGYYGGGFGGNGASSSTGAPGTRKFCDSPSPADFGGSPLPNRIVEDTPVPVIDCDNEYDTPRLVYTLIPVSGTRYEMKGVAADGKSQLRVVLDPKASRVPAEDCGRYSGFRWRLSVDDGRYGTIGEGDRYGTIYTAPESFPVDYFGEVTVKAIVDYSYNQSPTVSYGRSDTVEIRIVRPPVVMIHGLGDTRICWYEFEKYLVNCGYYLPRYNYRVDYRDTNTDAFRVNVHHVGLGITRAKHRAMGLGIMAEKCDIIGHSMGGILARLYVQNNMDNEEINRIITLNTPHAGSEIGDAVSAHRIVLKNAAKILYGKGLDGLFTKNVDAVADLAVESDAIAALNSFTEVPGIPVYAVATQSLMTLPVYLGGNLVAWAAGTASDKIIGAGINTANPFIVTAGALLKIGAAYGSHVFGDISAVGAGDIVVSTPSQTGGCEASDCINPGPWHCDSPKNFDVMEKLADLLKTKNDSPEFSTGWFHPAKRTFDHTPLLPDMAISMLPVVGDIKTFYYDSPKIMYNYWHPARKSGQESDSGGLRCIKLTLDTIAGYSNPMVAANFYDSGLYFEEGREIEIPMPPSFSGSVRLTAMMKGPDGTVYCDPYDMEIDAPEATLDSVETDSHVIEVGESLTPDILCYWNDGTVTVATPESVTLDNPGMMLWAGGRLTALAPGITGAAFSYGGKTCRAEINIFPRNDGSTEEESDAICSSVTLSFKQTSVFTRQAFRGVLSMENGHSTNALRNLRVSVEVTDTLGRPVGTRFFQTAVEEFAGFEGETSAGSPWTLGPASSGSASFLFIPTRYAAPEAPVKYRIGGSFSYTDPYSELTVTRELSPTEITVSPSPVLEMTYFMQRDVLADDPLTEAVEPKEAAEFTLLINNRGFGDAANMSVTARQPQIIENQKGLDIDFELVSSQLNGREAVLTFGEDQTIDFGTIGARSQAYAQWWLESSLLGHFVEYDVRATHVRSYDNPDLSLLDTVTVHELIRSINPGRGASETASADGDVPLKGFLVNDEKDMDDLPDRIYFSDGTSSAVALVQSAETVEEDDMTYILYALPSEKGWNYGRLYDPTIGRGKLVRVVERTSGAECDPRSFWQTSVTLRDGKDPLYESRLHFVDDFGPSAEMKEFTLVFEPKPELELAVDSICGIPSDGTPATDPVRSLRVFFNKPVDASSFGPSAVALVRQSEPVADLSAVEISRADSEGRAFDVALPSPLTDDDGFYVLTFYTHNLLDTEGYAGRNGKSASWTQLADGNLLTEIVAEPAEGGTVAPSTSRMPYGVPVRLTATPAVGFRFGGWADSGGCPLSADTAMIYTPLKATRLVATFEPVEYPVSVICDASAGSVGGDFRAFHHYGDTLSLHALPLHGALFAGWTVNGEARGNEPALTVVVDGAVTVEALFDMMPPASVRYDFSRGWNWMTLANDAGAATFSDLFGDNADRINAFVSGSLRSYREPGGLLGGDRISLVPGECYRLCLDSPFAETVDGVALGETSRTMSAGWNPLPFVGEEPVAVADCLAPDFASEGEFVRSLTSFAVMHAGQWHGSLQTLLPGEGYSYYALSPRVLAVGSGWFASPTDVPEGLPGGVWTADSRAYEDNMPVVCRLRDSGGGDISGEGIFIGAFVGDECRGVAGCIGGLYYLTVNGDSPESKVEFRMFDSGSGLVYSVTESVQFGLSPVGTVGEPFRLTVNTAGLSSVAAPQAGIRLTPNPASESVEVVVADPSSVRRVEIVSVSGGVAFRSADGSLVFDVTSLLEGNYLVIVTFADGRRSVARLVIVH